MSDRFLHGPLSSLNKFTSAIAKLYKQICIGLIANQDNVQLTVERGSTVVDYRNNIVWYWVRHWAMSRVYTVSWEKWSLQLLSITTLNLNQSYKYFMHKISSMLMKLYYIFVRITFCFLPLPSCLLTVPVSSIFHCIRFTVSSEWPVFAENSVSNILMPYLFSCRNLDNGLNIRFWLLE